MGGWIFETTSKTRGRRRITVWQSTLYAAFLLAYMIGLAAVSVLIFALLVEWIR